MDKIEHHSFPLIGSSFRSTSISKKESLEVIEKQTNKHKFESFYMYRSFLCSRVVINEYNWTQITMSIPHFISEFFNCLSQTLFQNHPRINIFIVVELIEIFLHRDGQQTILNLIQYNIPFILLWNLENSTVRDFTINLINLPMNYYKLEPKILLIFSKYLRESNFFIDFLNLLINKDYQISMKKMSVVFKLDELNDIYELSNNLLSQLLLKAAKAKKLPGVCSIPRKNNISSKINFNEGFEKQQLVEERMNLTSDIDRILQCLNSKDINDFDKLKSKKKKSLQKNLNEQAEEIVEDCPKRNSQRALTKSQKVYPSLIETLKQEEEAKIKEKIQLSTLSKDLKKSKTSLNRSKISLSQQRSIREISNESLSISRDVSHYHTQTDRNESRKQFKTFNSEDESIYSFLFSNNIYKEKKLPKVLSKVRKFSKKSQERTSLQFNNLMLKMIHPDVKHHIYISHFQKNNAPLTRSILGAHALPSKAMGRSLSLPSLSKIKKEIKKPEELDILATERPFTPNTTQNNEDLAYPMSLALNDMILVFFENFKPSNLMIKIGIQSTAHLKTIQCIQGKEEATFFILILRVF